MNKDSYRVKKAESPEYRTDSDDPSDHVMLNDLNDVFHAMDELQTSVTRTGVDQYDALGRLREIREALEVLGSELIEKMKRQ